MKIREIVSRIEEKFPSWIQEDYDNTGSQVLFPDEELRDIYICLEADLTTIDDAVNQNCNLIISHHPMIFRPVKKINSEESGSKQIIRLIQNKISLYSLHTNFDKMMYSYLSDVAGFEGGELLLKTGILNDSEIGFGSIVTLKNSISFKSFIEKVKVSLKLDYLIYSGPLDADLCNAVFINGAGGGAIEKIIKMVKPDCIVTGDVGYHHVKYALDNNVCVIDAGHFGTEIIFKKLLAESIRDIMNVNKYNAKVLVSAVEENPFKVYR